jgi:LptA/(LptD N-terminal domain) LPS transport protein
MNPSRVVLLLLLGWFPTGVWAQNPSPSPKPKASPRASVTAKKPSASPSAKDEKKQPSTDLLGGGTEAKGPTEITAKDDVQFDVQTRTAVFSGGVKVVDPQFTMTSDKLIVTMNRQEDGGGMKEARAEGNVIIVHANQAKTDAKPGATPTPAAQPTPTPAMVYSTARSQRAIYNAKDESLTLLGWPQITEGINTHISTEEGTRMILYRDGHMKTIGASRTILQQNPEPNGVQPNVAK